MKKIFILFAATVSVALSSCQKNRPEADNNEMSFDFSLSQTKATSSEFEVGDAISLYAVHHQPEISAELQFGGNLLNNEKLVYGEDGWTGSRKLYWPEGEDIECDFYAVYPYQNLVSVEEHPFNVIPDQNSPIAEGGITGYEASDLLYSSVTDIVKTDNGKVSMGFHHIMSKCVVTLTKGENFKGVIPDDITTHIYNTITSGVFNFSKGTIEKDAIGSRKTISMRKISNERFEAVVIPQNIERRTPLIEVTMGGIAYLLEYSLSFKPGYVHTINLILNTSPDQEKIEISIDPSIRDFQ